MRQRVGFARALVVEPELLLMDEPFSALDVLTAENLRTEILELWTAGEFPAESILIVTHNIEEAVMFADRVIVLGTNPGTIKREMSCSIERPRDRKATDFEAMVDEIYGLMTQRPDAAAVAAAAADGDTGVRQVMLPHASVDGIAGLAELAGQAAADADLGDLAAVVGFEIDDLFPLVDALALLGFATVDGGRLVLTEPGREFAGADIQLSKEIFRDAALARVPLVRRVHRALKHSADGALREGFFLDLLNRHYSPDEARAQLDTAIDWGRYAELFEYDAGRGEVRLGDLSELSRDRARVG
jgi:NitT/TauT family transport system ATP-binding protein